MILNIVYIMLNLIKIGENFAIIFTIEKIIKNRLSHYDVKEIKVYKLPKTVT